MYSTTFYLLLFMSLIRQNPASAQLLGKEEKGKASFYAQMFDGRKTSRRKV